MYLPRRPKKAPHNPFKLQASMRFMYASAVLVVVASTASLIYTMQQVQLRERRALRELRQQRPGQRVVIVGGGAGGAALAAALCNSSPDLHVTVVEKDRKQTVMVDYPFAHVGHKSYDLNTTGGIDFLRSPASWNVTRDAHLVAGEVLQVRPDSQEVIVAPVAGTAASFSASKQKAVKEAEKDSSSSLGWLGRVLQGGGGVSSSSSHTAEKEAEKGARPEQLYRDVDGGLQAYPYDVLILACGAKRTLGPLTELLPNGLGDIDAFGIAVNPGVTRDTLAHLFQGNVVQVKVPPKSFYSLMEAERKRRPPPTVLYDGGALATGSTEDSGFFAAMARLSGLTDSGAADVEAAIDAAGVPPPPLHLHMFATARQHDSTFVSTANTIWKYLDYFNKFSYCHLIAVAADADPLGPAPVEVNDTVRQFWKERQEQSRHALHLPRDSQGGGGSGALLNEGGDALVGSRGGGFVVQRPGSKEKTIVVRLPEEERAHNPSTTPLPASPSPPPTASGTAATALDMAAAREAGSRPAHFHFLNNSYLTAVDPAKQRITLYNHVENTLLSLPYRLLLLDLPLQAPAFVRASGLARGDDFARHNAPEALLRQGPSPRRVPASVRRIFEEESGFADVDPTTLQHRRYANVFAIGDVAGVPSEKSYGAVFAQVPVVAHNVKQVLHNAKSQVQLAAEEARYREKLAAYEAAHDAASRKSWRRLLPLGKVSEPTPTVAEGGEGGRPQPPSRAWLRPRAVNAVYDGYSSFPVIMTTWRAMWPEMKCSPAAVELARVPAAARPGQQTSGGEDAQRAVQEGPDLSRRLVHCDNHLWNNLRWWDLRGFANGVCLQMAIYEFMYFFAFNRGVWYPPGWFSIPSFSATDGTMQQAVGGWRGFL